MPVARPAYFWEATTKLEVQDIALSASYREEKEGNRTIRVFEPDWLQDENVMWNPAQRLKGWLKQQGGTIRSSARDLIAQGVKVHNIPQQAWLPIAESGELACWDKFSEPDNYRCPNGLGYPFRDIIKIRDGGRISSRYNFYYLLPRPIVVGLKISCFARNISPEAVEDLMRKLGGIVGLGDRHSSGENGLFKVLEFQSSQERLNF